MSATPGVNERLEALTKAGTSVWLDMLRRSLVASGELERLISEDSLRGVTSNPAIFAQAMLGSPDYDEQIKELAESGQSGREVYRHLAVTDVQHAADVMRGVWDTTDHLDGYVSLEVAPRLARDTEGTIEQARMYWKLLDRPNCMIKIPGTDEGLPAIEEMLYEGLNINVTLLFGVEAYRKVMEAHVTALERRHAEGKSLDVHSVASFFVSRVDTEVDKRLEKLGGSATELAGTAALANARAAYQAFKEVYEGERFAALRAAGAPVQRPLWASTGVKNPAYPATKYVDGLVAPHTVNTMPMATLTATAEQSELSGATADADPSADLARLAEAGIDMGDVTTTLLEAGIEAFKVPFEKLLANIESRREAVVQHRPKTIEATIPDALEPGIIAKLKAAQDADVARRVWKHDETLWGGPGPEIGNRLGWLTIADKVAEVAGELKEFAEQAVADGFTDAVLLGMGGSSLAPEVLRRSFGDIPGGLRLHVLDSTDAETVLAVEAAVDLPHTLFIVSSKSGGTIEPNSMYAHFRAKVDDGSHYVAVTDPDTSLGELAARDGFRHVFVNDPNIGGRYSALSYFGMVPAALAGIDIAAVLDRAGVAEQASVSYDSSEENSGLWLGVVMGALAAEGRDKLTFVVGPPLASFGLWAEQLVAESTGKHGRGILPVAEEPLGDPSVYGDDRVFMYLRNVDGPDAKLDDATAALAKAGHPVITVGVHGPADLGRVFFFAEFAVAVTGWALDINPFDQPNVQEAKDNTNTVLAEIEGKGGEVDEPPDADDDALRALLDTAPPHYVAIMGYVHPSDEFDAAIAELRAAIRAATKATTTFGYGPRFLHSTGQFHKGGPKVGRFLQLIHDGPEDADIPGRPWGFTTLKNAQAIGDLQTLRGHGLPAERVRLEGDAVQALKALTARIEGLR